MMSMWKLLNKKGAMGGLDKTFMVAIEVIIGVVILFAILQAFLPTLFTSMANFSDYLVGEGIAIGAIFSPTGVLITLLVMAILIAVVWAFIKLMKRS